MKRVKWGHMLGFINLFICAYNVHMLLMNTDILRAWYSLCFMATAALAALSFYNANRWESKSSVRSE